MAACSVPLSKGNALMAHKYWLRLCHGLSQQQCNTMVDPCILVDNHDKSIGIASKNDCHLLKNIHAGMLHRAFSVFLFSRDRKLLLLQKRATTKITFPNMSSNTVCSHPQADIAGENEDAHAMGVKKAASRRLSYELALPENTVRPQDMHYITRIHYYVRNVPEDETFGEHEIDYILFAFADVPVSNPRPEEVSQAWYVSRDELQKLLSQRPQDFTPWFRLIADNFLFDWWSRIHKLDSIVDHKTIHNFCILKS